MVKLLKTIVEPWPVYLLVAACVLLMSTGCGPKAAVDQRGDNSADYLTIQTPCGPKRIPRNASQEEVDRILGSCSMYGR